MKNTALSGYAKRNLSGKTFLLALAVLVAGLVPSPGTHAANAPARGGSAAPAADAAGYAEPAEIGPAMNLVIGKSTLLRLPAAIDRISVGNPTVADVTLISSRELYLLGKTVGATNVILWRKGGSTTIIDVNVNIDAARLQSRINELLPDEKGIKVSTAADSVVLSGEVSSATKAEQAVSITDAYVRNMNRGLVLPVIAGGGQAAPGTTISVGTSSNAGGAVAAAGSRVVNMLRVSSAQQVMLEVKVAEVSKTLLDKLGSKFSVTGTSGTATFSLISSFLVGGGGSLGGATIGLDGEVKDSLVKILAEPMIMAISGQEGSFLAGGKIFIPVQQGRDGTISLEEKEFGVGLKFTPTVLDGGRINLKVAPEVSELNPEGVGVSVSTGLLTGTTIMPSITTRRAQTTVQLNDGQSFAIGGLIKNNVTENLKAFPGLGLIPILGALFRSTDFQNDRTELLFVITPRLVKPLPPNYALPGDNFVPPSTGELFFGGKLEGDAAKPAPVADAQKPQGTVPATPAKGGFDDQPSAK